MHSALIAWTVARSAGATDVSLEDFLLGTSQAAEIELTPEDTLEALKRAMGATE